MTIKEKADLVVDLIHEIYEESQSGEFPEWFAGYMRSFAPDHFISKAEQLQKTVQQAIETKR